MDSRIKLKTFSVIALNLKVWLAGSVEVKHEVYEVGEEDNSVFTI